MPSSKRRNEALARAGAETAERLALARISNDQSKAHIDASREALARSMATLAQTGRKL